MQKQYVVVLLSLLALTSGCGHKKKKIKTSQKKSEVFTEVDIPVAGDNSIRSFFDDEVGEFALADDAKDKGVPAGSAAAQKDDFSWVEESADANRDQFKIVYFDFDQYTVRADQETNLAYDITEIKKVIAERGENAPTIVIDGHACHSAGSHVYNLALSEKRAKVLADRLIAEGIPADHVKIVGRGMEVPAIVNGHPVDGDREQQWPNRRDEIRILYS